MDSAEIVHLSFFQRRNFIAAMYIHQYTAISPQQSFENINLEIVQPSIAGRLSAIEPVLKEVPPAMLRRMSKAVRMGIGSGLPLMKDRSVDGIVIGTANGGMEDCIKFLNQIVDYEEGLLTPGSFVQSTPNAIAGQLSLITKNRNYNATHVHKGLAFENALTDVQMLISDNPGTTYIMGGVDEISTYNYNIDYLAGWYNKTLNNETLYNAAKPATIAGEGAAMFLINDDKDKAVAKLEAIEVFQTRNAAEVKARFEKFIQNRVTSEADDTLFITGENGDIRHLPFYEKCAAVLNTHTPIVRYKHFTGEYPTASSFGVWLACYALQLQQLPDHFYKTSKRAGSIRNIILYNQYQSVQHSFIFVTNNF